VRTKQVTADSRVILKLICFDTSFVLYPCPVASTISSSSPLKPSESLTRSQRKKRSRQQHNPTHVARRTVERHRKRYSNEKRPKVPQVTKAHMPSREDMEKIVARKEPVLLSGLIDEWQAIKKWCSTKGILSSLSKEDSAAHVSVQRTRIGSTFRGDLDNQAITQVPLQDFFNTIPGKTNRKAYMSQETSPSSSSSPSYSRAVSLYLAQCPMYCRDPKSASDLPQASSLMKDIHVPHIIHEEDVSNVNLWVSSGRTRSNLHYDEDDNLLCLVSGTKNVTLLSPLATRYLHPRPVWDSSANHSNVGLVVEGGGGVPKGEVTTSSSSLAQRQLPKGAQDMMVQVKLRRGQSLYIPEGWWHCVESAENDGSEGQKDDDFCTIAVNIWFKSSSSSSFPVGVFPVHMEPYYLRRLFISQLKLSKEIQAREIGERGMMIMDENVRKEHHPDGKGESKRTANHDEFLERLLRSSGKKDLNVTRSRIAALIRESPDDLMGAIENGLRSCPHEQWARAFWEEWDPVTTEILMSKLEASELSMCRGNLRRIAEFYDLLFGAFAHSTSAGEEFGHKMEKKQISDGGVRNDDALRAKVGEMIIERLKIFSRHASQRVLSDIIGLRR